MKKRIVPKKGMPLLPRTLEKFRLEVTALLVVGHDWNPKSAAKAVRRWDKYVRRRWKEGKPPCAVADHLSKWKKEGAVCPCKGRKRDCSRCGGKGVGGDGSRRHSSFHSSRRDAENPKEGELFESKRGNRWRIKEIRGDRFYVENEGRKTPGVLAWSKRNIEGMKLVEGEKSPQLSLFKAAMHQDPPGRRGKRKTFIQSILFHKRRFTIARAKAWARRHGFRFGKVDVQKNYYRLRQVDPKLVKVRATITMAPGILGVVANMKVRKSGRG